MTPQNKHYIDAHVHLQDSKFDADRHHIIGRAIDQGVQLMVCNGTHQADWHIVNDLARQYPQIIPCFGLHPWFVSDRTDGWLAQLEEYLLATPSCLGEIGLDRWVENRDESAQEHAFRQQLQLAAKLNRPVMIHCLRAWGWLMDILNDELNLPPALLIHAYGGAVDLIKPLSKMNAYFSFAGDTLDPKKTRKQQALLAVPQDRLLIETDAPDIMPPLEFASYAIKLPNGQYRNDPANLPMIYNEVARLRNEDPDHLIEQLMKNANTFIPQNHPAKNE